MAESINIPINVSRGNLSGIDDLERRLTQLRDKFVGLREEQARIGERLGTMASTPGALSLQQLGFQQTPYGIARAGYTGGRPPVYQGPTPGPGATDVRPGGVRPYPPGIQASPFGRAAGGPAGAQAPGRPGSPQWLAQQGYAPVTQTSAGPQQQQAPPLPQPFQPGQQQAGPSTPLQLAHATMLAQQRTAQQQGLQHAQLVSLAAQMGPQQRPFAGVAGNIGGAVFGAVTGGGGIPGTIGGALGGAVGTALGGVPGMFIGSMVGATIGKGIQRGIDMGMQGLEMVRENEVSLLRLGDTLNQQFSTLRTTVTLLRRDFQVLGRESVPAMLALARATGMEEQALARATYAATAAGRSAGMTATEAVGLVTEMQLAGTRAPDLSAVLAIGNEAAARYPGAISPARFATETVRAAQVGGLGFAPMSGEFAARNVELMMGMGGRYTTQPAAAIEQRALQMGRPQSTVGQVLQISALDRLRQRQRYVTLPDGTVLDLNDLEDMRIAAENIYQIPEARESLRQEVVLNAPGNVSLQRRLYGHATTPPTALQARLEWQGTQEAALKYGSLTNYLGRPADLAAQSAREAARRGAEADEPGLTELRRRTVPEEIAETVPMRAFEEARSRMQIAFGDIAQTFNNGLTTTQTYFQTVERLTTVMQNFTAVMDTLVTAGTLGMTQATGVGGTGVYPTVGGGASWTMVRDFVSSLIQTGPRKVGP